MQALRLFGSDFTLLERMFPGRQRKALKHKLRREYKADHARLDAALSGGGQASLDSYKEVVALLQQVRSNLCDQMRHSWTRKWGLRVFCRKLVRF